MAKLLDHEVDGIQEYDNPTPPWLAGLFIGCILYSIGYVIYYPSFWFWPGLSGWSSTGQYEQQMTQAEEQYAEFRTVAEAIELNPDDPAVLELGAKLYRSTCAACHGLEGEGRIGPSFIDGDWLYGADDENLIISIRDGRPKGMPPWGSSMSAEELGAVASYVRSLMPES